MSFLIQFINLFFLALNLAIIARVLLSWINPNPYHPVIMFIYQVTEPILAPLRRIIPPIGMIDISPLVAIILLEVVQRIIVMTLIATF
ncbi:MAG: YggT family protein [Anaerolineae bacterium]